MPDTDQTTPSPTPEDRRFLAAVAAEAKQVPPLCRAEYPRPANVEPHTRIVRCSRLAGHDGPHDELVAGERGLNAWSDPPPPECVTCGGTHLVNGGGVAAPCPDCTLDGPPPAPVGRDTPAVDLDAIEARAGKAHEVIVDLCNGRPWRMSVPARPDRDDDLVLDETVSRDVAALVDEIRRLTVQRDMLQVAVDDWARTAGQPAPVEVLEDATCRRVWAAALRWASTGPDRDQLHWRPGLWRLADQIEAGVLSPWTQETPADPPSVAVEPPAAPGRTPEPTGDGHGLILARGWLEVNGRLWRWSDEHDCWRSGQRFADGPFTEAREVLLVDPSAGPVLDAAVDWRVADLREQECGGYDSSPHVDALAAAVDAATGNQPAAEPDPPGIEFRANKRGHVSWECARCGDGGTWVGVPDRAASARREAWRHVLAVHPAAGDPDTARAQLARMDERRRALMLDLVDENQERVDAQGALAEVREQLAELRELASRLATAVTLTMPYWRTPGEQVELGRLLADARRAGLLDAETEVDPSGGGQA